MGFLRLFTNSLLAGALGAAYLTILLLHLNPEVPLVSHSVWRWYATLGVFYGVHLALLFYVTMLLRDFVSVDIFSPGWISVRLLAWLSAAAAAVAATLMWLNLNGFPTLFDESAARRFAFGAGASLEYVWPRVAAGRLPNFGRVLDTGASMDLATIRPTQPDPVWAAVATGMYPAKNGVRSAASYFARGDDRPLDLLPDHCFSHTLLRLDVVRDQPNSSARWLARPPLEAARAP